ncbi:LysR family transcriptional regulator [Noviherbaspirillum pedocola]|uniref:LysR family transcriptional regulator n=1 Tax=Noviherbaspirillum pedocola TaxID=2801341 RepID=A0A934T035_9BURK|nr:LysR family transcriptional regulator [Noviherbaspirillum pedocola]MBK4738500.1 LysR family transcriptional regulator [Noviherbaspirillum pedocola]
MDQLQAMRVFAAVAEQGSFARAARHLEMSGAVVTRNIGDLENHLAIRLLNRTTRRLSLTEAGQVYLRRVTQILQDLEEANAAAMAHSNLPTGTLCVYAQLSFGETQLSPVLSSYKETYPNVALDVTLTERTPNLVDEGFDVGFFLSPQRFDATMIARQLGVTDVLVCASPEYIARHGEPKTPQDLAHHACLNFTYEKIRHQWSVDSPVGTIGIAIKRDMVSNNGELLRQCAVNAMGIIMRPAFALREDLETGRLVRLLSEYDFGKIVVTMVYPSRRHVPAKVSSFIDFIMRCFPKPESDPWSTH